MPKEARTRWGHLSANPQPRRNLKVLRRHRLRAIRVRARALAESRSQLLQAGDTAFDLLHELGGRGV